MLFNKVNAKQVDAMQSYKKRKLVNFCQLIKKMIGFNKMIQEFLRCLKVLFVEKNESNFQITKDMNCFVVKTQEI